MFVEIEVGLTDINLPGANLYYPREGKKPSTDPTSTYHT